MPDNLREDAMFWSELGKVVLKNVVVVVAVEVARWVTQRTLGQRR